MDLLSAIQINNMSCPQHCHPNQSVIFQTKLTMVQVYVHGVIFMLYPTKHLCDGLYKIVTVTGRFVSRKC